MFFTVLMPLGRRLRKIVLVIAMGCTVLGCHPDAQSQRATDFTQQQLLLKAKRAILNIDLAQLDVITDDLDVNRPLPDKSSLLAWAVETQDPRLVSMLLAKGATVQPSDHNRFSPIIEACRYGNSAIINALLDRGADVNSTIEDGTTALHLCAGSASVAVLARMVTEGAIVSADNAYGQSALMFAANAGNVANLNYLIEAGAKVNKHTKQGYSPLFFAIKSHNLLAVQALIASGADVLATAADGTTAAQLGVYSKNYEFLTWFISELDAVLPPQHINSVLTAFDRDGYQLLHSAVKANQVELVRALLDQGAAATTRSAPSKLKWRYEANFKSEAYIPPQLTPLEIAEQHQLSDIAALLRNASESLHAGR